MTNETDPLLASLYGHIVVLDLAAPFLAIGTLEKSTPGYYLLVDADLHDLRESGSTRDYYLYEVRQSGLKTNRKRLLVRAESVVALCAFDAIDL